MCRPASIEAKPRGAPHEEFRICQAGERFRRRRGRSPTRCRLSCGRHQPARPDEGRHQRVRTVWSTSRVCRGSIASSASPMAALRIGALVRNADLAHDRGFREVLSGDRRGVAFRRVGAACATPRPSAAICCSGRDAPISMTPPAPATSASPARAAMRGLAKTACTPCSAGARPASPPIRRISACRSWRSTRWWRSRARLAGARWRWRTLHRLPGDTPERDSALEPGDLIVALRLPAEARDFAGACALSESPRAHLLRLRRGVGRRRAADRRTARSRDARLALGGVAAKPWRARAAEKLLAGCAPDAAVFRRAAEAALADAKPSGDNAFKIELARRVLVRALTLAAAGTPKRIAALPASPFSSAIGSVA